MDRALTTAGRKWNKSRAECQGHESIAAKSYCPAYRVFRASGWTTDESLSEGN